MTAAGFYPRWLHAAIPERHWHFCRRLHEQYGLVLASGGFVEILRETAKGYVLMIEGLFGGKAIFFVHIRSVFERAHVLVAKEKHLITAMPPSKRSKKLQSLREAEQGRAMVKIVQGGGEGC
jgi:hypothetical protein